MESSKQEMVLFLALPCLLTKYGENFIVCWEEGLSKSDRAEGGVHKIRHLLMGGKGGSKNAKNMLTS